RDQAVSAQIAADVGADHGQLLLAAGEGRRVDVAISRRIDVAGAEHVERDAVRVGAIDDRLTGRHAVDVDHLQSALGLRRVDVVLVALVEDRHGPHRAYVVGDAVGDVAAHAAGEAVVGVAQRSATGRAALAGHAVADEGIAAGVGAGSRTA